MKEYITIIEFNTVKQNYKAHVREEGTTTNLFTTSECSTTDEALKQTQSFFSMNKISNTTDNTVNSTLKNYTSNYQSPVKGCCGR